MTRGLRAQWRRRHEQMLQREKDLLHFPGPPTVLRYYNSFTSFFRIHAAWEYAACRPGDRVLLVGDGGGKDYWYFAWQGVRCEAVDVAEQALLPGVIIADISAGELPFAPETFDAIVMCDVLEHIYNDCQALANVHRLLKPAGRLVLSGPYWHDFPEHHVRLHSPRIVERMLQHHGFRVESITCRGFLVGFYRVVHPVFLFLHYLLFQAIGRHDALSWNRRFYRWIFRIQSRPWVPYLDRRLWGMRGGLNGYVLRAAKTDCKTFDAVAANRAAFTNMGLDRSHSVNP